MLTSGVFEREAVALHAVLLDRSTGQVVDSADGINLGSAASSLSIRNEKSERE
jgi:hypothetical protein